MASLSPISIVHTSAFRQSLAYLVLFALSISVLLGFLYWNTLGFLADQTDKSIEREIVGLDEQFRRTGLRIGRQELSVVIRDRSHRQRLGLYQLRGSDGQMLGGNLKQNPLAKADKGGWISFDYYVYTGSGRQLHQARGRVVKLPLGHTLLVGRDTQGLYELEQRLQASLIWVIGFTLLLGLGGGVLISQSWLKRVDSINQISREIMAGNLSLRIPVTSRGDELDLLARNLNRMLNRIEDLLESLRQVTDNVAHDLRTPLNRLRSRLEVALIEDRGSTEYRNVIELAVTEADELLHTFNAMLTIAEAEAGRDGPGDGVHDLGGLAEHVAELYAPLADQEGLELTTHLEEGVEIHGNAHLLSQMAANLVDNAIKYTKAPGVVSIYVHQKRGVPEFIVLDSGPGIPDAQKKNVLKRFYRLDESRQSPGNGLGLSLVATVARIHNATLSLENADPGLCVRLTFDQECM